MKKLRKYQELVLAALALRTVLQEAAGMGAAEGLLLQSPPSKQGAATEEAFLSKLGLLRAWCRAGSWNADPRKGLVVPSPPRQWVLVSRALEQQQQL